MKTFIAMLLTGTFFMGATASADVLYHCEPAEESLEVGWVQASMDNSGKDSLAILWKTPAGREDIEETAAEIVDDFTVYGYHSEKMNASLLFYTADDGAGERNVLELDGREIPVVCNGRN